MLGFALLAVTSGLVTRPSLAPRQLQRAGVRMESLFVEPTTEEMAAEQQALEALADRDSRLKLVAERYNLDPDKDGLQIAAYAASSLPEEE